jgi:hypothetical protein
VNEQERESAPGEDDLREEQEADGYREDEGEHDAPGDENT